MANKQIILLDVANTDVGDTLVKYAMWFYPPLANQVPKPGVASQWRGASAQDTTNIQSGAVVEEIRNVTFLQNMTLTQMKTYLLDVYNARQTLISNAANPNQFYGAFFDGTTWTGV